MMEFLSRLGYKEEKKFVSFDGYNDHPDGEMCYEKMYIGLKKGIFPGCMAALLMFHGRDGVGFLPVARVMGKFFLPFPVAGLAFAATACLATNVRNKDDYFNYAAAGGVAGAIAASPFPGPAMRSAFFWGGIAWGVFFKYQITEGFTISNDYPKRETSIMTIGPIIDDISLEKLAELKGKIHIVQKEEGEKLFPGGKPYYLDPTVKKNLDPVNYS